MREKVSSCMVLQLPVHYMNHVLIRLFPGDIACLYEICIEHLQIAGEMVGRKCRGIMANQTSDYIIPPRQTITN